jgi:hypothetical protein
MNLFASWGVGRRCDHRSRASGFESCDYRRRTSTHRSLAGEGRAGQEPLEALNIILEEIFPQLAAHVPGVVDAQNLLSDPSQNVAGTTRHRRASSVGDKRILDLEKKGLGASRRVVCKWLAIWRGWRGEQNSIVRAGDDSWLLIAAQV